MDTTLAIYACRTCGFEFEYDRAETRRRIVCDDCRHAKKLANHRRWSAGRTVRANGIEAPVLLPDGHPVLPVLARYTHLTCAMRLALAAIRTGHYDLAEKALQAVD